MLGFRYLGRTDRDREASFRRSEHSVLNRDAADFSDLPRRYFDIVLINMAIFYVEDLAGFFQGVARVLKPGGQFVFSLDDPLRHIAYVSSGVDFMDAAGAVAETESYLRDEVQHNFNPWTGKRDLVYRNRPLGTYINGASAVGLHTSKLVEPRTRMLYDSRPVESPVPHKVVVSTTMCVPEAG